MGLDFEYSNGQTPLDEDEKDGILIPTIATRGFFFPYCTLLDPNFLN